MYSLNYEFLFLKLIFLMMNFQIHQNTPGPRGMYILYSNFAATTNSFE